jgi:hypothetical protein
VPVAVAARDGVVAVLVADDAAPSEVVAARLATLGPVDDWPRVERILTPEADERAPTPPPRDQLCCAWAIAASASGPKARARARKIGVAVWRGLCTAPRYGRPQGKVKTTPIAMVACLNPYSLVSRATMRSRERASAKNGLMHCSKVRLRRSTRLPRRCREDSTPAHGCRADKIGKRPRRSRRKSHAAALPEPPVAPCAGL